MTDSNVGSLLVPAGRIVRVSERPSDGTALDPRLDIAWDKYLSPVLVDSDETALGRWRVYTGYRTPGVLLAWRVIDGERKRTKFAEGGWDVLLTDRRLYLNLYVGQADDVDWYSGNHTVAISWPLADIDLVQGSKDGLIWTSGRRTADPETSVDLASPAMFLATEVGQSKGLNKHGQHVYKTKNVVGDLAYALAKATWEAHAVAGGAASSPEALATAQARIPLVGRSRNMEAVLFNPAASTVGPDFVQRLVSGKVGSQV